MEKIVRIGSGAGFAGDRIAPAVELVEKGQLDFIVFECLAERTIALAQAELQKNPHAGFDPLLESRLAAVLPAAVRNKVRIVSNMGAANPVGAARAAIKVARDLGICGLKVAAVTGDDVLEHVVDSALPLFGASGSLADLRGKIVSANAYLGAAPIVDALDQGADVVLTGRVSDAALFLAPLIHSFGWKFDDWDSLARGTAVGHLLECAGQLTGGYFANPGSNDVSGLSRLGFPLAEVDAEGHAVFTKVAGTGGTVSVRTCKEQLLYEVLDPAQYIQPDVIADFSKAQLEQQGPDRVRLNGVTGKPRPDTLKVSVGYHDGFVGEGEISYAGRNALQRGRLAADIVRERLEIAEVAVCELDLSMIGVDAVNRTSSRIEPAEVRARVAGRADSQDAAREICREVEALYTNGPAGGGGVRTTIREVIAIASVLLDRSLALPSIAIEES